MMYAVIGIAALAGSALTFFSGFGLGTILAPVFALFFPVDVAIALTAVVHFLNNIFKLGLVGKKAAWRVVLRFGLPSLLASFAGALLLGQISGLDALWSYHAFGGYHHVTPVKLTIAAVLLVFVVLELVPRFAAMQFDARHMVAGGLLSGFFGGLSGNQGALRSAFLIKAGLPKESFVATGVVIACMVDAARLTIYSGDIADSGVEDHLPLMTTAMVCAFAGAFIGSRLIKKMTLRSLQVLVALLLTVFALLLAAGIV